MCIRDRIATDHAPHSLEEKSRGFAGSAFGIVGMETAFPVMYTELVEKGVITLDRLIDLMYTEPRKRFGMSTCSIEEELHKEKPTLDVYKRQVYGAYEHMWGQSTSKTNEKSTGYQGRVKNLDLGELMEEGFSEQTIRSYAFTWQIAKWKSNIVYKYKNIDVYKRQV